MTNRHDNLEARLLARQLQEDAKTAEAVGRVGEQVGSFVFRNGVRVTLAFRRYMVNRAMPAINRNSRVILNNLGGEIGKRGIAYAELLGGCGLAAISYNMVYGGAYRNDGGAIASGLCFAVASSVGIGKGIVDLCNSYKKQE